MIMQNYRIWLMMIDVHPKDWRSETFTRNTISHFGERCLRRALTWNFSVDWLAIAWLQCVGIYRSDFVQKSPVLPVLLGCNWNAIVGRVPSAFGGNWGSLSCWCNPYSGLVTGRRFSFEKSNRAYWIILIILIIFDTFDTYCTIGCDLLLQYLFWLKTIAPK
jgi:hypothetical protein